MNKKQLISLIGVVICTIIIFLAFIFGLAVIKGIWGQVLALAFILIIMFLAMVCLETLLNELDNEEKKDLSKLSINDISLDDDRFNYEINEEKSEIIITYVDVRGDEKKRIISLPKEKTTKRKKTSNKNIEKENGGQTI